MPGEKKKIDVRKVIERLGGPTKVHALLSQEGHEISKSAIEKWSSRRRIPSDWVATLTDLGQRIGRPINFAKFVSGAASDNG